MDIKFPLYNYFTTYQAVFEKSNEDNKSDNFLFLVFELLFKKAQQNKTQEMELNVSSRYAILVLSWFLKCLNLESVLTSNTGLILYHLFTVLPTKLSWVNHMYKINQTTFSIVASGLSYETAKQYKYMK